MTDGISMTAAAPAGCSVTHKPSHLHIYTYTLIASIAIAHLQDVEGRDVGRTQPDLEVQVGGAAGRVCGRCEGMCRGRVCGV